MWMVRVNFKGRAKSVRYEKQTVFRLFHYIKSYLDLYMKNSIPFSRMQTLSLHSPIITELIHNSYPETCILRTGKSPNILAAEKQQQVLTKHDKEPIKGKFHEFFSLL